jgi:hypothetical protein
MQFASKIRYIDINSIKKVDDKIKSNDEKQSIKNIISSMKLSHLKELTKIFEIHVSGKIKEDFVEIVSFYIENNISVIMGNFITYEEYTFIEEICDNNYTVSLDENHNIREDVEKSLEYLGIIYSYYDFNERKVSVPFEIRETIKLELSKVEVIEHSKENQELIELFKILLDIYGVIPQDLLLDYVVQDFRKEYKVHEAIKNLWRYNNRYNLYYSDYKLNYCNTKIIDMRSLNEKLSTKSDINYKYYDKSQLKNMSNRNLHYIEKEIYVVLKRHFKSSDVTLKYLEYIRIMIKNDISSREISEFIMNKTKRMSEQGRMIIEGLVDRARIHYPLWTLKGHSLKDLKCSCKLMQVGNSRFSFLNIL